MAEISIVMAVYNGAEHLAATIESIQNQSFKDWEFIIVDDASTDITSEIATTYQQKDKRIQLIRNEQNKKLAASLNYGISRAKADLIARQDCGDFSAPDRLEKQFNTMQANKSLVLLGSCYNILTPTGDYLSTINLPETDAAIRAELGQRNPFAHGSLIFRKNIVQTIGNYREDYLAAQDYELWTRLSEHGGLGNLKEALYSWRLELDSTSLKRFDMQYAYMRCVQSQCTEADLENFRKQAPIIENYLSWLALVTPSSYTSLAKEISQTLWDNHGDTIRQRHWMLPFVVKQGMLLAKQYHNLEIAERFVDYVYPNNLQQQARALRRICSRLPQFSPNWKKLLYRIEEDYKAWPQLGLLTFNRLVKNKKGNR